MHSMPFEKKDRHAISWDMTIDTAAQDMQAAAAC
jgi:hypothetical protein